MPRPNEFKYSYAAVTQKNINGYANQNIPISKLLWTGSSPVS